MELTLACGPCCPKQKDRSAVFVGKEIRERARGKPNKNASQIL